MNAESVDEPSPNQGSRRARIWELTSSFHCPVIGVCIPLGVLRKLVLKWLEGKPTLDDFEIHGRAVSECNTRNPLSESIQRTLDDRLEPVIRAFKAAKTPQALLELWQSALASGDLSGALWAALTHPRCNETIAVQIYRDIHMAQHQAGAHARVDQVRLATLNDENAILTRELGRVQIRLTNLVAEKSRELLVLQSALNQAAAQRAASEVVTESLQRQLAQYRDTGPALNERLELQRQLAESLREQRRLRRELLLSTSGAEWFGKAQASVAPAATAPKQATTTSLAVSRTAIVGKAASAENAANTSNADITSNLASVASVAVEVVTPSLERKVVLCVGGRIGNLPRYRQTIERLGAQFSFHDGGIEQNHHQLEANLAAADLVVCQTGCISHNSYWRVKDHCKRTGKQCVFVENPSVSALALRLESIGKPPNESASVVQT
jgi:Uncharacterized protein conserved in bacteria (DUF2325)